MLPKSATGFEAKFAYAHCVLWLKSLAIAPAAAITSQYPDTGAARRATRRAATSSAAITSGGTRIKIRCGSYQSSR